MKRQAKKAEFDSVPRIGELPLVAILGRPNVGKSTLFNRLVGRQISIVEGRPGVTRDRIYADCDIVDKACTLVDMGGFEISPTNEMEEGIGRQCLAGLEQADLVLFVVDGRAPTTPGDTDTAALLRKSGLPSILVVNKIDGARQENGAYEAFSLGLEPVVMVSALHGRGVGDLEDLIYERLPEKPEMNEEQQACRVAIVGRPNAGKSSLVNSLLGEDRLLALPEPGTTRDAVDSRFERNGKQYVLIDTAGLRRKRSIPKNSLEKAAVDSAIRAFSRCDVAVVLLDAGQGAADQDAKVLGLALDRGCAAVIGCNKWDLLRGNPEAKKVFADRMSETFSFAQWVDRVELSALEKKGLGRLLDGVDRAYAEFCKRVTTSDLNRLFEDIVEHHPPPSDKGRAIRLYYATQTGTCPPVFVVHANYPASIHFSYRRYVQNRIRETFGFQGVPIRLFFRKRSRRQ